MAMPFNIFARLTCLHIAYFLFALVALKTPRSRVVVQHPLAPGAGVTIQQAEAACWMKRPS